MSKPAAPETRVYLLQFYGDDETFLGLCLVVVTRAHVDAILPELVAKFPQADHTEGGWVAAACRVAWTYGCNAGGNVAAQHLETAPAWLPINRLLSREHLAVLEAQAPPIHH